ncbi:MAG: hypothetical protein M1132_05575 [Chloroflexi bacterium]|nr:hypothetical protein [Chloroflexota bacterium]
MSWPTPADYQATIQNPNSCFEDPELRNGTVITNALGLPKPISGAFATVFQMDCNGIRHAVRCLYREYPDVEARYMAISSFLQQAKLPYTVEFVFLPRGIRVRGQWYPVLKMEWVDGESLGSYVQKQLNSREAIRNLAIKFQKMVCDLDKVHIAHGDLQHGNIMVTHGELRLVDYDGMYVPSLAGMKSNEFGHRNYQHPSRSAKDYGSYLDHFSAWAIYVSIVALSLDPSLWSKTNAGDDCLLFRKEDFEQPPRSSTLALLESHPNATVRALANVFGSILCIGLKRIPTLDGQQPPLDPEQASNSPSASNWWSDHAVIPEPKTRAGAVGAKSQPQDGSWILDLLLPPESVTARSFTGAMSGPRLIALIAVVVLCLPLMGQSLLVPPSATVSSGLLQLARWWLGYFVFASTLLSATAFVLDRFFAKAPALAEKRACEEREGKLSVRVKELQKALADNPKKRTLLQSEEIQQNKKLSDALKRLQDREKRELDDAQAAFRKAVDSIEERARRLDQNERSELTDLRNDRVTKQNALNREIDAVASAWSGEVASGLVIIQSSYIENYLKSHPIGEAPMPGVTSGLRPKLENELRVRWISTAFDISYNQVAVVPGFGRKRTQALVDWRNSLERQARRKMPKDLNPEAKNAIAAKYAARRKALEVEREALEVEFSAREKSMRGLFDREREVLGRERQKAQEQATQDVERIKKRYAQEYAAPSQDLAQLEKEFSAKLHENDEQAKRLGEEVFAASREVAKRSHEYKSYRNIDLSNFLKAVLFGSGHAGPTGRVRELGLGLVYLAFSGFIFFQLAISPIYSLSQTLYAASALARAEATEANPLLVSASLATLTATPTPTALPTEQPTATESPSPTVTVAPTVMRVLTVAPIPSKVPAPSPIPVCPNPNARITYPAHNSAVRGIVQVRGTASRPDLNYYKVQLRLDGVSDWSELHQGRSPVIDGVLAEWNTSAAEQRAYWLRLIVADPSGNYYDPCEIRVLVTQ